VTARQSPDQAGGAAGDGGALCIVLHTHMPYVEGFGTWPFGEEWLWEAIATCYLPLLDVLERAPITLSLTPVLCDQLAAPGIADRCLTFLREVRTETHRLDREGFRAVGESELARAIERSGEHYARAAERMADLDGDILGALAKHVSWTSSATHAVLPLLATDAGIRLQVQTGIESHRARFGAWRGGFWLPECAYAPHLDRLLEEAGVHATCLDLTDVFGRGAPEHLRPLRLPGGPIAVPIDRETIELVWSDHGYPQAGPYRDTHRLTHHHHRPWANHGGPYDEDAAFAQARADAADFVGRVRDRLAAAGGQGLCVFAVDTELLGHWWHEGVAWLDAVVDEAQRAGVSIVGLDDALEGIEPAAAPDGELPVSSWGRGRDLSTWSAPEVADLAWQARAAELRLLRRLPDIPDAAVRALLAVQASDWAFQVSYELAGPYPRQRATEHARSLDAALSGLESAAAAVRGIAPRSSSAPLLVP
jgi:1,4-alpha-glucan branching enzyme